MPSPNAAADLLSDLAAACARLGVRWYVFGAQAALVWGRPRLTIDVDVTIDPGSHSIPELANAFKAHGFSRREESTDAFIASTRVILLSHESSGLAADVVLAGPGLEDTFLDRAVAVDINGVAVRFISPEDLIVTKLIAGRAKDLDDVRGILAERASSLDDGYVTRTLRAIEQGLGRSDLVTAFEALIDDAPG